MSEMRLYLQKPEEGVQYDITDAVESVTWGGGLQECTRTLEASVINAPYDSGMPEIPISTGDFVSMEVDDELVFFGQFLGIERADATGTVNHTAYDGMIHLKNSKGKYNFKNTTPEAITAQICADAQVPVGNVVATGVNIASMICDGDSLYDIIMQAYTKAYKATGKKYMARMNGNKLEVFEKGIIVTGFYLSDELNITSSSISESATEMVNLIKIYDKNGNQVGEVKDDEAIAKYGVFMDVYTQEDGIDATAGAKAMLKVQPSQDIPVEAIGEMTCLTGHGVTITDGGSGVSGMYWITSDSHTWKDGQHTMSLQLSFENLMDEKESKEIKESVTGTKKKKGKSDELDDDWWDW